MTKTIYEIYDSRAFANRRDGELKESIDISTAPYSLKDIKEIALTYGDGSCIWRIEQSLLGAPIDEEYIGAVHIYGNEIKLTV